MRDGQLEVTDVTGGVQGGTTQYTLAEEGFQVGDITWSPSGEWIAFVSPVRGEPHVYFIFAQGQSSPTDLGLGSSPAWSPDSQSLAFIGGRYPAENIVITSIETPAPRQLTRETNFAWGRPAFTADGQALIISATNRYNLGANGNTSFVLTQLALDGSGVRTPLPSASELGGVRLPYDVSYSPDGTRLAFSTSSHYSACASPGAYYVSDVQGGNMQALISPSLSASVDEAAERFFVGLNYAWAPTSDALAITGTVVDCKFDSPSMGQVLAGPQMSVLRLDGSESTIIPGIFYSLSMDRSGAWIAATHYQDPQDMNPMVEIYSAQTGQLLISLGPGNSAKLQP
jgi:dipeptidyl aminopeptidase/acylaminoacyl peptidase